ARLRAWLSRLPVCRTVAQGPPAAGRLARRLRGTRAGLQRDEAPAGVKALKHHCIVGYDLQSKRPKCALKIPLAKSDLVRRFVTFEADDPDGFDCYKMEYSEVIRLLDLLGRRRKPPEYWTILSNRGRRKVQAGHQNR